MKHHSSCFGRLSALRGQIDILRGRQAIGPNQSRDNRFTVLADFDPLVAEWFTNRFGRPTEPQIAGWREIRTGRDVLISAPTGSGKTLAAFLICLDGLVRAARANTLAKETQILYVSPLKALSDRKSVV